MGRDFGPIPTVLIGKSFFFFFSEHILFVHTISEDTDTVILFVADQWAWKADGQSAVKMERGWPHPGHQSHRQSVG